MCKIDLQICEETGRRKKEAYVQRKRRHWAKHWEKKIILLIVERTTEALNIYWTYCILHTKSKIEETIWDIDEGRVVPWNSKLIWWKEAWRICSGRYELKEEWFWIGGSARVARSSFVEEEASSNISLALGSWNSWNSRKERDKRLKILNL